MISKNKGLNSATQKKIQYEKFKKFLDELETKIDQYKMESTQIYRCKNRCFQPPNPRTCRSYFKESKPLKTLYLTYNEFHFGLFHLNSFSDIYQLVDQPLS